MKGRFAFLTTILGIVFSTLLISPSMYAQGVAARFTVPFDFSANHLYLPAGCYTVMLDSENCLILRECATGKAPGLLLVRTTPAYGVRPWDRVQDSLVFQFVGHRAHLTRVRFSRTHTESYLAVQPKPEREFARNTTGKEVEIAMTMK